MIIDKALEAYLRTKVRILDVKPRTSLERLNSRRCCVCTAGKMQGAADICDRKEPGACFGPGEES